MVYPKTPQMKRAITITNSLSASVCGTKSPYPMVNVVIILK